ncbi:lipocalin-like domain-containing protein [Azospirillum sp. ST 5-10]|uniref:lipocalin-like domain-containing protein n=1 Tax=unclassified Azospirillum TaxID=2630922 RepID=UPI003F4A2DD4
MSTTYRRRNVLRLAGALVVGAGTALPSSARSDRLNGAADTARPNKVLGAWRPISVLADPGGRKIAAYGPDPAGLLVFTKTMNFIEVLHDPRIPKFASDERGKGTAEENQAAMAGSIGFYGTYTVDAQGEFSGNTVEGSTFPNWIGHVRTRDELTLTVEGDRMTETFRRPEGTIILIAWERVR